MAPSRQLCVFGAPATLHTDFYGNWRVRFSPIARDRAHVHTKAHKKRTQIGLGFFEIAFVLVRLDHVARFIKNADHGTM
jgi:hypothetical protein